MQTNNRQICEDSLARYGVRKCKAPADYQRALLANNSEYSERQRAYNRKYRATQKALGKRQRKCPDGKCHLLTDKEFDALYGKSSRYGRER